jgi:hypothetical protein
MKNDKINSALEGREYLINQLKKPSLSMLLSGDWGRNFNSKRMLQQTP